MQAHWEQGIFFFTAVSPVLADTMAQRIAGAHSSSLQKEMMVSIQNTFKRFTKTAKRG